MPRDTAIQHASAHFDAGAFLADLGRRVACQTESQEPARAPVLHDYLSRELVPTLERMGFKTRTVANSEAGFGPFLLAERHEDAALPTVLSYGHGDVVRGYNTRPTNTCWARWRVKGCK